MQRRSEGVLRTVSDLIGSRMRGQVHLGDSIAVWTFNDTLSTGKLPLQEWSEGEQSSIADHIVSFLQEQKFEKKGQLEKLLPALIQVVKNSEFITVILISEGGQDFHGTPFDQQINQAYKQWNVQQEKAHMPLITVLRARHGLFTNYSVTPAPWAVDMPPLPAELVKPKAPPPSRVVSAPALKPAPPPMAPPLIISGRKPEPAPPPLPPPATNIPVAVSNQASNPLPSTAAPNTLATIAKPADLTGTSSQSPTTPAAAATTAPPVPPPAVATNVEQNPVPSLPPQSLATPPAASETKPPAESSPPASQVNEPPSTNDSSVAVSPQVAVAPGQSGSFSTTKLVAIASGAVVLLAGITLWLWKRRSRSPAHVSLITRSLDRDKP